MKFVTNGPSDWKHTLNSHSISKRKDNSITIYYSLIFVGSVRSLFLSKFCDLIFTDKYGRRISNISDPDDIILD